MTGEQNWDSRLHGDSTAERCIETLLSLRQEFLMSEKERLELLQGTLDMLILKALDVAPMHGFGVAIRIQQMSQDVLQVEQGSLYPALYRLENRGWISSTWGLSENNRKAKFYKLTIAGRKQLRVERENWQRLSGAINLVMGAV